MKYSVLIFFLFVLITSGVSQNIREDPAITKLMREYVQYNELNQRVRGWRVQILATTDRRQIERAREEFEEIFPDYNIIYTHEDPYYQLKSGAFLTQADARPFLAELREVYKSAYIVADDIDVADVLDYQ